MTDDVQYMSPTRKGATIAQANSELDAEAASSTTLSCRQAGDSSWSPTRSHVGVARALVSVAAALIPFLENDDANRADGVEHAAAVPLIGAEAPWWAPACISGGARLGAAIAASAPASSIRWMPRIVFATEDVPANDPVWTSTTC